MSLAFLFVLMLPGMKTFFHNLLFPLWVRERKQTNETRTRMLCSVDERGEGRVTLKNPKDALRWL